MQQITTKQLELHINIDYIEFPIEFNNSNKYKI